jgi:hypothetical protein
MVFVVLSLALAGEFACSQSSTLCGRRGGSGGAEGPAQAVCVGRHSPNPCKFAPLPLGTVASRAPVGVQLLHQYIRLLSVACISPLDIRSPWTGVSCILHSGTNRRVSNAIRAIIAVSTSTKVRSTQIRLLHNQ